jgi:bifunctional DNase/RNase
VIEVVLRAVRVDVSSATPVLLLEEVGGRRVVPIYVGAPEAAAIAYAIQGIETPRPMTHDLLDDVIEALGGQLQRIEVAAVRGGTYEANLKISQGDDLVAVSARPSDAVALALRAEAPMFVAESLLVAPGGESLEQLAVIDGDEVVLTETDEASLVDEMRSFLDSVRPEDFES